MVQTELLTMRERRRIERDELIAGKYKALIKEHPECSHHRIMSVIANELGVTATCVRVSLIRTGNHTPRRRSCDKMAEERKILEQLNNK